MLDSLMNYLLIGEKDAEANLMFLRGAQDAMNEKLKRNGPL